MADRSQFDALHARAKAAWDELQQSEKTVITVIIHGGSLPVGSRDILRHLELLTLTHQVPAIVRQTGSLGFEFAETVVQIKRPGEPTVVYGYITEDDVVELFEKVVVGGRVWAEKALGWLEPQGLVVEPPLTLAQSADEAGLADFKGIPPLKRHPFLRRQTRWLSRRWGRIDPESIDDYIAEGGYHGFVKALVEMTPDQVIEEMKKTNIRGRGGAGFQMGIKWESGRRSRGNQKYVICNGHEGEPNVFKDRRTFESDPHAVLEGIMIGCVAIGATIGYAFIGGEFPLGIKRFKQAVKDAERAGLLGKNVLGSGIDLEVRVRIGGTGRHGRAVKVWEKREYRNLDDTVELGTRNIKVALRRLRRFAREGAAEELDIDGTIDGTARQGWLDIHMRPERRNTIKVLLFLDVGGSMDGHIQLCEELFSAARTEFKNLEFFYIHNCLYEGVWKDNRRRHSERIPTWDLIHKYPGDWRAIFVGDATMSPYEVTMPGGSVEHWNEEAGAVWLKRAREQWDKSVWLNPVPERHWSYTPSVSLIGEVMEHRMFPLTLEGLERAMRTLAR